VEQPPTDPAACASAPMGDLAGTATRRNSGGSEYIETRADVTWTLASTTGCVDRYEPRGTVAFTYAAAPCTYVVEPAGAAIGAADGELIVDRTTNPPTYRMHGVTEYQASMHCAGEPAAAPQTVGGEWTDHEGSFDGGVVAGGLIDEGAALMQRWRFARTGSTFPAPVGCSEPAVDRWSTVTESGGTEATLTWTRTATTGCVDTFAPSGTARALPRATNYCVESTFTPDSATVGAGDGVLTIDRSTAPATFRIDGMTAWPATWHCKKASGTVESEASTAGGPWAGYAAEYDGDQFGGAFEDTWGRAAWRFTR
jgi:hypothetical protein